MKQATVLALVLLAAACGGKSSKPAQPAQPPVEEAPGGEPMAMGGDGYGGDAYGGDVPPGGVEGGVEGGELGGIAGGPRRPGPVDPPELAAYLPEPAGASGQQDPAAVYAVPVDGRPSVGPAAAAVTIVATYEFRDPFSERLRPVFDQLTAKYGKDLRIVWRQFIVHRANAQVAALGACAANKQGKFQPFMAAMYERAMAPDRDAATDLAAVVEVATAVQLDAARFDTDLRSPACRDEVIADQQLFERIGQQAVPVTYINGRALPGAQPIDAFTALVDEELAKAKAAFKKGTKPAKYYDGLVKKGRTGP